MPQIPINAVTMRGWKKLLQRSHELRIRQDGSDDDDRFYILLEMQDGSTRYLIDNDDEVKSFDTRRLCTFLRKHTEVKAFDFYVNHKDKQIAT